MIKKVKFNLKIKKIKKHLSKPVNWNNLNCLDKFTNYVNSIER